MGGDQPKVRPPLTAASAPPAKQWTGSGPDTPMNADQKALAAQDRDGKVSNAEEFAAYMKKADPKSYRAVQAEIEKKKKKGSNSGSNSGIVGGAYSPDADQVLRNIKGAK